MKLKNSFLLILMLVVILSCNGDDDSCTPGIVEITSLEAEYGCVNTKNEMEINLSDDFVIITSQSDFDSQVTGSCQPDINFSIYDLVIGKKALTSGNTSITYELLRNCDTQIQTLTVTFVQNATTEAPNLTYHALIPKLENGQVLEVDIIVN
ncbi:hypothetical protein [Constantimarinum furrinae]|uniref:Uncharacterized protein n=1 Tax=Constantimarinum furrinae TaxID=2562285 RepID=A0A7G8PT99_9FLAO|nr:hypothetical protein [Constantimarinum furrinae]QNJ97565.1 hypothetical protein ALE3EI_0992 [Constantimarinum furrinae]